LRDLLKHFSERGVAVLGQLVFTLRRPVLLKGFITRSAMREVALFAPHRQLWESETDVSEAPETAVEELRALFEGEVNGRSERVLYLAPGVSSDFLSMLVENFELGWVASCAYLSSERELGRHNVAVYDLNNREWLNVDFVRTRCWLMDNILREASLYQGAGETVLSGRLRLLALQAEFFWELLSSGVSDPEVLFELVGCRRAEDAQIILALCKKDYHLNPLTIIDPEKLKNAFKTLT